MFIAVDAVVVVVVVVMKKMHTAKF